MEATVVGHCPAWIGIEILEKILQGDDDEATDDNRVVIYQVKADPAVAKGENFSSELTRVSLKFTKGHKTGFKCVPRICSANSVLKSAFIPGLPS